jgi:hypothetical protein
VVGLHTSPSPPVQRVASITSIIWNQSNG